jgi:hypothetical protein
MRESMRRFYPIRLSSVKSDKLLDDALHPDTQNVFLPMGHHRAHMGASRNFVPGNITLLWGQNLNYDDFGGYQDETGFFHPPGADIVNWPSTPTVYIDEDDRG